MCSNRSSGHALGRECPRENSHVVGAFGMLGEVEALTLAFDIGAQAYDDIDDLVENSRPDHTSVVQTPQSWEVICAPNS